MRPADAARVAELTTQLGYPARADEVAGRFSEIARRDDQAVIVAVDADDRPLGWIHVAVELGLAASSVAGIHGLVVDEAHRSAGIGRALLEAAEAWARDQGCRRITVRSRVARERAHRFYEREGYGLVKESRVYGREL